MSCVNVKAPSETDRQQLVLYENSCLLSSFQGHDDKWESHRLNKESHKNNK